MKNLIVFILLISPSWSYSQDVAVKNKNTTQTSSTSPEFKSFNLIIEIPAFPDFDPSKFFQTEKGKTLEKLWMNEEFLEEFYTEIRPEEAREIKEHPSFKLRISNTTEAQKIGPVELFLISAHFVNILDSDEHGNLYIIIEGKKFYLNTPLQAMIDARCVLWSNENGNVFLSK